MTHTGLIYLGVAIGVAILVGILCKFINRQVNDAWGMYKMKSGGRAIFWLFIYFIACILAGCAIQVIAYGILVYI